MTKLILDSGDPQEYRDISNLSKEKGYELWGSTTNPTLIAKKLAGKKLTHEEAFQLQKEIIDEITHIVPGAVSAEVYADDTTRAEEMIEQGREIASWHQRVVVKLPTTFEGFKARTILRKENIITNNTLVFSQEQIFAICLHEHLIHTTYGNREGKWPPFISPFVGRLDDIGEDGLTLVKNGMEIKKNFPEDLWMLEASVRTVSHLKEGMKLGTELITAPASIYSSWLGEEDIPKEAKNLRAPSLWQIPDHLKEISTLDEFYNAIKNNELTISHELTSKGIIRFVQDWQAILK